MVCKENHHHDCDRHIRHLRHRLWPPLDDFRPLPDCQSNARPMADCLVEYLASFVEIAAGVQHPLDLGPVLGPFFDLVKIAMVREQRGVGFFAGPA
jgi:hypothetical protein